MKYLVVIECWNGSDCHEFDTLAEAEDYMDNIDFEYEENVYIETYEKNEKNA